MSEDSVLEAIGMVVAPMVSDLPVPDVDGGPALKAGASFLRLLEDEYGFSEKEALLATIMDDDYYDTIVEILSWTDQKALQYVNELRDKMSHNNQPRYLKEEEIIIKNPEIVASKNIGPSDEIVTKLAKEFNVSKDDIIDGYYRIESGSPLKTVNEELRILAYNLAGSPAPLNVVNLPKVAKVTDWVIRTCTSKGVGLLTDLRRAIPLDESNFDGVMKAKGYSVTYDEILELPNWYVSSITYSVIKGEQVNIASIEYTQTNEGTFLNAAFSPIHNLKPEEVEQLSKEVKYSRYMPVRGIIKMLAIKEFKKLPTKRDVEDALLMSKGERVVE